MPRRLDERGQALVLSLLALAVVVACLAGVVNSHEAVAVKLTLQDTADAAAYSAAVMQARGLNVLAALNGYLRAVDRFYTAAVASWFAAVAASAGCKCPQPVEAWWRLERPLVKKVCDPQALGKIAQAQDRIVRGFNNGTTSPAVVEARAVGQITSEPLALASPFEFSFQARHWALNFEGGPRDRAYLPALPVERGMARLPRSGAAGIKCSIPPTWHLHPDYARRAYVFTPVATKPRPHLVGAGLFGPPRPFAAIALARPVHDGGEDLDLTRPRWRARLARITPAVMDRFRRSSLGGYLADFPASDDSLLRH